MAEAAKDFTSQFAEFDKTLETNFYLSKTDLPGNLDAEVILATSNAIPDKAKYPNFYAYWINLVSFHPSVINTWKSAAVEKKEEKKVEDDDDVDLFGSDDEDDKEAAKELAERKKKEQDEKKKAKKEVIAKSIIFFDVKVYEQEQNLDELANKIRTEVILDGLVWNNEHKILKIAFGMNKLQMICVVEDAKVGQDDIFEKILEWEDEVQSVDVVSFQKV